MYVLLCSYVLPCCALPLPSCSLFLSLYDERVLHMWFVGNCQCNSACVTTQLQPHQLLLASLLFLLYASCSLSLCCTRADLSWHQCSPAWSGTEAHCSSISALVPLCSSIKVTPGSHWSSKFIHGSSSAAATADYYVIWPQSHAGLDAGD